MNLYKLLGYKGALPFIVIAVLLFVVEDKTPFALAQMAYASMILSFLGGVHWAHGLPRDNHKQVFIAMQPTIFAMFIFVMALATQAYAPMLGLMALLFPLIYIMDQKYLDTDQLPEGYFAFRKNLTLKVSVALLASAAAFLF